jgi:hypothetical protein
MSKIDDLVSRTIRMEEKMDGFIEAQKYQARMLSHHDKMLRGDSDGQVEGLCEQVRNINKRHALVATFIPIFITAGWEYLKRKLGH